MSNWPTATSEETTSELAEIERVIDGLQRAWMRADDERVEQARREVEASMQQCAPEQREVYEGALARLDRARRQARLRHRKRH